MTLLRLLLLLILIILLLSPSSSSCSNKYKRQARYAENKTTTVDELLREAQCELNDNRQQVAQSLYERATRLGPLLKKFHLQKGKKGSHFYLTLFPNEIQPESSASFFNESCARPPLPPPPSASTSLSEVFLRVPKFKDGVGHIIYYTFRCLCFCYHHNITFGGFDVLANAWGIDEKEAFNFFFGDWRKYYAPLVFPRERLRSLNRLSESDSMKELHQYFGGNMESRQYSGSVVMSSEEEIGKVGGKAVTKVYFIHKQTPPFLSKNDINDGRLGHNISHERRLFSHPSFLHNLREMSSCGVAKALSSSPRHPPLLPASDPIRLKVVIHIRLGAAASNPQFNAKIIPLSFYLNLMESLAAVCGNCVLHAFTSVQNEYNLEVVDELRRNMTHLSSRVTLYVDREYCSNYTSQSLDVMAHMITADVLVTARSSFSHVAALLNPKCVVFFPTSSQDVYMDDWVRLPVDRKGKFNHDSTRGNKKYENMIIALIMKELPACLRKTGKSVQKKI